MQLLLQFQQNAVADEVAAITAVVRPILEGLLNSLKGEVVAQAGGRESIPLFMLPRLYRPGDRDCGICFEYAVHDALNRGEPTVVERIQDAMNNYCNVPGTATSSILFGLEKSGALNLIDTAKERLTEDSRLRYGSMGQPARLKRYIDSIATAFRRKDKRLVLPFSISGIWKADLFVGFTDTDRWVGTTVKINPNHLEGARGLRIGIVPAREGQGDVIRRDDQRNLIVCPLPHDGAFMEMFYLGWGVVQQFIHADAKMPKEAFLPRQPERQVARYLFDRRDYPVVDVIEALGPLAQPELIRTEQQVATLVSRRTNAPEVETASLVAPVALQVS